MTNHKRFLKPWKVLLTLGMVAVLLSAQIPTARAYSYLTFTVFLDQNGNGIMDGADTPGVDGVNIRLFEASGASKLDFTTNPTNGYSYSSYFFVPEPLRAELVSWPTGLQPSAFDSAGTDLQFIPDGSAPSLFFGLYDPSTYCANNALPAGCSLPIELGNRVWNDTNGNGVQDSDELGIAGVTVELTDANGNAIAGASAQTDANGNYLFNSAAGANSASSIYGLALQPNTAYQIRIDTTQAALAGMTLTQPNAIPNPPRDDTAVNNDARDSDAVAISGEAIVNLTTGTAATNNYSADIGFVSVVPRFDLALRLTNLTSLVTNFGSWIGPNRRTTFTAIVFNQGTLPAYNVMLTAYLAPGYVLDDASWIASPSNTATRTIAGPIAPGTNASVDLKLWFPPGAILSHSEYNEMEISAADDDTNPNNLAPIDTDSTPDAINGNQPGEDAYHPQVIYQDGKNGGDEDDHDVAYINISDVSVAIALAPGQSAVVHPGDLITYTITVTRDGLTNQYGDLDVSAGFSPEMSLADATWVAGPNNTASLPFQFSTGNVSQTINLTLRLNTATTAPLVTRVSVPLNGFFFISGGGKVQTDDANASDNQASVAVSPPIYDLALIKTLTAGQSAQVAPGDLVNYTLTVKNQGNVPSGAFTVSDQIPGGMSFVSASGTNITCSQASGLVTCAYAPPVGTDLAPNATTTIALQLHLDDATQAPFRNWAEISSDSGNDIDSTPDTNTGSDSGSGTGTPPNDQVNNTNSIDYAGSDDEDDNDYDDVNVIAPTAITLTSFTAARQDTGMLLRWTTDAELHTWGFQLLRSADGTRAHAARVTPTLILAQGRGQGGAAYAWMDATAKPAQTYTYWLEETELDGNTHEYGPVVAQPHTTTTTTSIFLPIFVR